jgi:hypothetical protein
MDVRRAMDSTIDASSLTGSIREAAAEVNSIQRDLNRSVAESTAEVKKARIDLEKSIGGIEGDLELSPDERTSPDSEPESESEPTPGSALTSKDQDPEISAAGDEQGEGEK